MEFMKHLRSLLLFGGTICFMVCSGLGQTQAVDIPPPLRVKIPFEKSWQGMVETLQERQLPFVKQGQEEGEIQTDYHEYSSGPLTESHIAKIGVKPRLIEGDWVRVTYRFTVEMDLIKEGDTLVTVSAKIQALQREFLGTQKWVEIPSNGRLESELLSEYGKRMFGQLFTLAEPRKGFWEQAPGYVKDADVQPRIAGPERPPR